MSLYLQIALGAGRYLLDASHIVEIRSDMRGGAAGAGSAMASVDLRAIFDEPAGTPGPGIVLTQNSGELAVLVVDRIDGLAEFDDAEFCPLPPIGPLATLLDAVTTRLTEERPLLRLRGERALAGMAALV
ncbi:MAG TPA: hypothetical protein VND95_12405 [Stellaceae bacterium]|nr:hypothetical protein [Stellaceae bacterium]